MATRIFTMSERPELAAQVAALERQAWPAFMLDGHEAGDRYWHRLASDFADHQIAMVDDADALVAVGNSIPLAWDGDDAHLPAGWDAVLAQGFADRERGLEANTVSALAVAVAPSARRRGHSHAMLLEMRAIAAQHGCRALIAPLRPTLKSHYPLAPIGRYCRWTRDDGKPFDPWIRTHLGLGARLVGPSPRSMVYTGTVAEWEAWTGMSFPDSGPYVIAGALVPLEIDREADRGVYEEPNVWVVHAIAPAVIDATAASR